MDTTPKKPTKAPHAYFWSNFDAFRRGRHERPWAWLLVTILSWTIGIAVFVLGMAMMLFVSSLMFPYGPYAEPRSIIGELKNSACGCLGAGSIVVGGASGVSFYDWAAVKFLACRWTSEIMRESRERLQRVLDELEQQDRDQAEFYERLNRESHI